MYQTTTKNHVLHKRRRIILAVLFLAVLCLGAAELVVCRFADPELYDEVTGPVRACAQQAAAETARLCRAAGGWISETAQGAYTAAADAASAASKRAAKVFAPRMEAVYKQAAGRGMPDAQLAGPTAAVPPLEMVDESVSHLEGRSDLEFLTGGGIEVVYYNQVDPQWSGVTYGADPLSGYGCGPTAMSMVVSTLLQRPVDPEEMSRECVNRGYWARRSGSYLSIVPGIAEAYGLNCQSIPPEQLDQENLMLHLATGDLAVALMTRGHFTNSGHFIILRGLTLEGDILVADPASRERSLTPWPLSLLISELSPSRHDGAPLWLISATGGAE